MALEIGIKGVGEVAVTLANTAQTLGSGELPVFATPALAALVERTAWESVAPHLAPGQGTVGTRLELSHEAPTPVGMAVSCATELVEVDRRRLVFSFEASDAQGRIARGMHERFIVDNARFVAKAEAKAQDAPAGA